MHDRDRRSRPRLTVNLDAVWEANSGKRHVRITNLSEGGCYLDTVGDVSKGEIVSFRILLPDDDWLYLEGEVRHSERAGFGVQFVDLDENQVQKIQWLMELAREAGSSDPITADLVED
jgi:hypothetical protein